VSLVTRVATALAQRPAAAIIAAAAGPHLPTYITRDQARAIINAGETTMHRLLLETLWQTGGRVTEVLRLRLSDLVEAEGALRLTNLKTAPPRAEAQAGLRQPGPPVSAARVRYGRSAGRDFVLFPFAPE